ncbi:hypothetical protein [Anaerotruncus rubiinfantis]|uniref:hypothetical protein n=1 Tax=Anaerotruncus rubiinfantis TaxID=1720200 RepID=UPI00082A4832|nr:hypothetical protein [Anaerotruncus rubiinfantis]
MPNEQLSSNMQQTQKPVTQPDSTSEFYRESFAEVLVDNIGIYVTCEFLIGTGGLVDKSGILYAAGVNFVTLYDDEQDRYITCDLYSLKFVTFYGSRPTPRNPNPASRTMQNNMSYPQNPNRPMGRG